MTDEHAHIRRRPRLDRQEHQRLLEELARYSDSPPQPRDLPPPRSDRLPRLRDPWEGLESVPVNKAQLAHNRVITAARRDPAHAGFDILRARLVQTLANNGWRRVALTSPTVGCGKSFVAANPGIALSRYENCRTVLLDLNLRRPALADMLGIRAAGRICDFLRGDVAPEDHLQRIGENTLGIGANLALGLNRQAESFAAEIAEHGATADSLQRLEQVFAPDIILCDMPPVLPHDDVIAFRPHYDAVLMLADGSQTTASEIRESLRRLGEDCPLLGVLLNRAEDGGSWLA